MSQELATDLIRWTFTVQPDKTDVIEEYLTDLGLDVLVFEDNRLIVSWDDPDLDTDSIIEHIWELNGEACDVTHEAFHRVSLLILHQGEEDSQAAA